MIKPSVDSIALNAGTACSGRPNFRGECETITKEPLFLSPAANLVSVKRSRARGRGIPCVRGFYVLLALCCMHSAYFFESRYLHG